MITGKGFFDPYLEEALDFIKVFDKSLFHEKFTYAFDLISPSFIRKIKYNSKKLILLTVIKNKNGKESPLVRLKSSSFPFYLVPYTLSRNLTNLSNTNIKERGFVIKDLNSKVRYSIELNSYKDKILLNTGDKGEFLQGDSDL